MRRSFVEPPLVSHGLVYQLQDSAAHVGHITAHDRYFLPYASQLFTDRALFVAYLTLFVSDLALSREDTLKLRRQKVQIDIIGHATPSIPKMSLVPITVKY